MKKLGLLHYLLAAVVAVFIMILGVTALQQQPATEYTNTQEQQTLEVMLSIAGIVTDENIMVSPGTTVLTLLTNLSQSREDIQLTTETYEGLGTLITGFGGLENGRNNKYWQYRINGIMPQIGADQYTLEDGDLVEWVFTVSEF